MTAYKSVVAGVVVAGFAAWVVALAGIATITADCYNNYLGDGNYVGHPGLGMNCVRGLQFQWWGVWFEFIVLAYILSVVFLKSLPAHQATLTALLATVTAINMLNARLFMDGSSSNYVYEVASRQSGLNVAAAGYVMFCTFNLILVLLLGSGLVWFKESDYVVGDGAKASAAAVARGPGPNFAQPATFASPLSGGGARAYLPNNGTNTGEVTISH